MVLTLSLFFELDKYMANKGYFILHKISKASHMLEYTKNHQNDIIFIGHSKAQNHISTAIFKQHNINIYTYGVSAVSFSDYPYMVAKAIKTNPKKIVIDISPSMIYDGNRLPKMQQPTFTDMLEQIKATGLPALSKNLLDIFPLKFYVDRYFRLLSTDLNKVNTEVDTLISKYNYTPDCEIFNYYGDKRILTLCTNGNGTVWYNNISREPTTVQLRTFNKATVDLLNHMLNEIRKHGIEAYILLEAVEYNKTYDFDINDIYKNIHIKKNHIIDSSYLTFDNDQWADDEHINGKGKEKFSSLIIDKLKEQSVH